MSNNIIPKKIIWTKRLIYFQLAVAGLFFIYVLSLGIFQPPGGWTTGSEQSFLNGFNRGFLERMTGETTDAPIFFEAYDAGYILGPSVFIIALKGITLLAIQKRMKKLTVGTIIGNLVLSLGSFSIIGLILEGLQLTFVLDSSSKEYFVKK